MKSRAMKRTQANPLRHATAQRGFSIIEIIVTMIIIGILVLILMPVLSNRTRQARIRAAEQEITHLIDAEERAAIDTTYMYRLYVLNDVIGGDNIANGTAFDRINGTRDISITTVHTNPEEMFIGLDGLFLTNGLTIFSDRFLGRETTFGWVGPYVNWKIDNNQNDWPDDPFGNDYVLFTSAGGIFPGIDGAFPNPFDGIAGSVVVGQIATQDGDGNDIVAIFDRPTILSMGPDGEPGVAGVTGDTYGAFGSDDIYRSFGGM